MRDFLEWLEDEIMDNFFFALVFGVCCLVLFSIWFVSIFVTYGLTALIPFAYVAMKYYWRDK